MFMNRRKLILVVAFIGLVFSCLAAPIDSNTARTIANHFLTYKRQASPTNMQYVAFSASNRAENQISGDAFYIFSDDNGFVIVSADDGAMPVLGYSDEGGFDASNLPIAMVEMLQNYEEQISYIRSHSLQQTAEIRQEWQMLVSESSLRNRTTRSVNPLIIDNWGQSEPCNLFCPFDTTELQRTVVGCAALSMAQVIHYWGYPTNGMGSHTYIHPTYGQLSADFANTTYLYHLMPNDVFSAMTLAQKEAISMLTYQCGVSMEMNYGINASSAYPVGGAPSAEYSFQNYFGYPDVHCIRKFQFNSDQEWIDTLVGQLDMNRPILYTGAGDGGNHTFVVDGYDNNYYLHINWGWFGTNNGYFALGNLNPGTFSFNINNIALIDVAPPQSPVPDNFIISLYSSAGGHFNPEGPEVQVDRGSTLGIQIIADEDHFIYSVVVDSADVGIVDYVEFDSIVNNHYIYVFFQSNELGVSEFEAEACQVYPNPTQGEVYVELPSAWGHCNLTIYDARGTLVGRRVVHNGSTVNLSHLSQGLYFFEMENGGVKRMSKIIKN